MDLELGTFCHRFDLKEESVLGKERGGENLKEAVSYSSLTNLHILIIMKMMMTIMVLMLAVSFGNLWIYEDAKLLEESWVLLDPHDLLSLALQMQLSNTGKFQTLQMQLSNTCCSESPQGHNMLAEVS